MSTSLPTDFVACGLSFRQAPLSLREQFSLSEGLIFKVLERLKQSGVPEALLLSTCNRTEIYASRTQPEVLLNCLAEEKSISMEEIRPYIHTCRDEYAIRHLMRLALGLDSMAQGESQIFSQIKQAASIAKDTQMLGSELQPLLQYLFAMNKVVRTQSKINTTPISISYIAIKLAKQIFAHLEEKKVLLIGAGDTVRLLLRYLRKEGVSQCYLANRTKANARHLANEYHAQTLSLSDIPFYLPQMDMVISATASPLPIIGKGMVERAQQQRRHKPFFMLDLAVPRDIEAEVANCSDVYLYTVDDLGQLVQNYRHSRQHAIDLAEDLVQQHVADYLCWRQSTTAVDLIKQYRTRAQADRTRLLEKAKRQLARGEDPALLLERFSHQLTNQLTHPFSHQLHEAGYHGQLQHLACARYLLDLEGEKEEIMS